MRKLRVAPSLLLAAVAAAGALRLRADTSGSGTEAISLPLVSEKLAGGPGASPRAFRVLELRRLADGSYSVDLLPREPGLDLPALDLKLLMPRAPKFTGASEPLKKIALIQREFNRNEVHNPLSGGLDFSLANNCLRQGLWEVKLAQSVEGKSVPVFHAWLEFPSAEYARLFEEVNGRPLSEAEPLLASYPKMGGLPVPLGELRRVESESKVELADLHLHDDLQGLPEQQGKRKFILTPAITSYGGFSDPANQPIAMAKFAEPGRYDPNDPMRCELSWLAHPGRMLSRVVRPVRGGDPFVELEIGFANGYRILLADANLSKLPARHEAPTAESDVLNIFSGIGTPVIHATAQERAREISEDRPRYLFLLDANGALVDNHLAGMDGIYLWREAGKPDLLHIWVVGYERIAFVAHFSAPWKF